MPDEIKVITRATIPDDKNFILATWLKGNRWGNPFFEDQDKDLYFHDYANHIIKTLLAVGTQVNIACDEAKPGWIVGYAVFKNDTLYWVHIRDGYRRKGIASLLLRSAPITTVKGMTRLGWRIVQQKKLIFDPR